MSVTDELLANNTTYAETFSGPLPPAKHVAVKPSWAAEAFADSDTDVRQPIARIKASPFIPNKHSVRGFVFDVATGRLNQVA